MKLFSNMSWIASATGALVCLSACGGGGGGGGGGPRPANAVADAGVTLDVARSSVPALDGSGSSDPEGRALTYRWTQVSGPDVTAGMGFLTGMSPVFIAPSEVSTLFFDLTVNDGNGDSAPDQLQINVLEHMGPSLHVDGDNGSDTNGDGSRAQPFATIGKALDSISGANQDIYVRSLDGARRYDETGDTLTVPAGTSLYGGYGDSWVRDVVNNRTRIAGHRRAVKFEPIDADSWISGFDITATRIGFWTADEETSVVSIDGGSAHLHILDNTLASLSNNGNGHFYGLRLAGVHGAIVRRNTITAGDGGHGGDGADGPDGPNGGNGANATSQRGGDSGLSGLSFSKPPDFPFSVTNHGGNGGFGGDRNGGNGFNGANGRQAGDGVTPTGAPGGAGGFGGGSTNSGGHGQGGETGYKGNRTGFGGRGGSGGDGNGDITAGFYRNTSATDGQNGIHGVGGGGGGGGEGGAIVVGEVGGGGGGGGAGGIGGMGGDAGTSGSASIGILVSEINNLRIQFNLVTSGNGGVGGAGGTGGQGGTGGNGGNGRRKISDGEAGGHGGGGGRAGEGGQGGAGAGGPSYAIMVGRNTFPVIENNRLIAGDGGDPGPDGSHVTGGAIGGRYGKGGSHGSSGGAGGKTYQGLRSSPGSLAEGGWVYGIYDVDLSDGTGQIGNNTITRGVPGNRGRTGDRNF